RLGGHTVKGGRGIFENFEVAGAEVAEMADKEVVILGRLPLFGLAQADEVARVQLKIGTAERDDIVEGCAVMHLNGMVGRIWRAGNTMRMSLAKGFLDMRPMRGARESVLGCRGGAVIGVVHDGVVLGDELFQVFGNQD